MLIEDFVLDVLLKTQDKGLDIAPPIFREEKETIFWYLIIFFSIKISSVYCLCVLSHDIIVSNWTMTFFYRYSAAVNDGPKKAC